MKTEKPIQHVSDTSHWIAHYRAIESAREDALFKDPLAAVLAQARGENISSRLGFSKPMGWSVAIRTFIIDQFILSAIADGVDAVVNLGAGLDTRPYRLDVPPQLKWIEADFPQVIDFKEQHLKTEKPRCELRRVRLDLSNETERGRFLAEINSSSRKVLVLTEGVVMYLTNEDAASLGKALAAQNNFHYWITDYLSSYFMKLYHQGHMGRLRTENIPFLFNPKNWTEFFKNTGWNLKEMRYLSIEGRKLGRPTPMPGYYRFFLRFFVPASKRETLKRMTGYALLSR
jgi:methyltransferase (TIGR00027 family)